MTIFKINEKSYFHIIKVNLETILLQNFIFSNAFCSFRLVFLVAAERFVAVYKSIVKNGLVFVLTEEPSPKRLLFQISIVF